MDKWERGVTEPRLIARKALSILSEESADVASEKVRQIRMKSTRSILVHMLEFAKETKLLSWSPNRVKVLRERLHITQENLANELDVSVSTVKKWEEGRNAPVGLTLVAFRLFESEKADEKPSYSDSVPMLPPWYPGMHPKAIIRKSNRPRPFRAQWERVSDSPPKFLVFVLPRAGKRAQRGDYANVGHVATFNYSKVELIERVNRTKEGDLWEFNRLSRKST